MRIPFEQSGNPKPELDNNLDVPLYWKLLYLLVSLYGGISSKDKPGLQEIVDKSYKSPQAWYNGLLETLESEIITLALTGTFSKPNGFSKGRFLQAMVGFADQHAAPISEHVFPVKNAKEYVSAVMELSLKQKRQLTIAEQLKIALEISSGNILEAAIIAHAGSRAIAKNFDARILKFTAKELKIWKDSVASFDGLTQGYGSPPADTYHFWGAFVAGLVSEEIYSRKDILLNQVYNMLYTHIAEFTDFLRYKIMRKGDGTTHKEQDLLGFHLGSAVASLFTAHEREEKNENPLF